MGASMISLGSGVLVWLLLVVLEVHDMLTLYWNLLATNNLAHCFGGGLYILFHMRAPILTFLQRF